MQGRLLQFITQIDSALDRAIPVIDLNPVQMPADYQAFRPDWNGAQKARQKDRASALVKRFAYLFDGEDLEEAAPGTRWPLRRVLGQMERHYGEHTARAQLEFELDHWPVQ